MSTSRPHNHGFTIIELMVVIMIMGMVAAVTLPRFYPAIAFTRLEGAARHMSNFGRAAMSEAVMLQQKITVRIDLDEQQYSAVRWVDPKVIEEQEQAEEEGEEDMLARLSELKSGDMDRFGARGTSPAQLMNQAERGGMLDYKRYMAGLEDFMGEIPEDFDEKLADEQMARRFEDFARRAMLARAANVDHEEFLDDVDIFEEGDEFSIEDEENEPIEMDIENPVLRPVNVTEGITLEAISVGGVKQTRGLVEIELSPLGLSSRVGFHFVNEDDDYRTVYWDPTLGGTKVLDGKESLE